MNHGEQELDVEAMKILVRKSDNVCTLCEQFASDALVYLEDNKTQTQIISTLHQSCLQLRSFKTEVVHDVDCQNILARFAITSAWLVGSNGPAQCGAFDITFMSCLPNMIVMAPTDEEELVHMVATAFQIDNRPVCFRYLRGVIVSSKAPICKGIPIEEYPSCHSLKWGSLEKWPAYGLFQKVLGTVACRRYNFGEYIDKHVARYWNLVQKHSRLFLCEKSYLLR